MKVSVDSQIKLTENDYGDTVTALFEETRNSPFGGLKGDGNALTSSAMF
jgi:hypothetical protein